MYITLQSLQIKHTTEQIYQDLSTITYMY